MSYIDDHLAEAARLTEKAHNEGPDVGRIEYSMWLTEANNHLLWYLVKREATA